MHSDGYEVLGPEHLIELGDLFEKTWTALGRSDDAKGSVEDRAQLACILLRLYGLKQLGPDQILQTALRLLKPSSPVISDAAAVGDLRRWTAQLRPPAASVLD